MESFQTVRQQKISRHKQPEDYRDLVQHVRAQMKGASLLLKIKDKEKLVTYGGWESCLLAKDNALNLRSDDLERFKKCPAIVLEELYGRRDMLGLGWSAKQIWFFGAKDNFFIVSHDGSRLDIEVLHHPQAVFNVENAVNFVQSFIKSTLYGLNIFQGGPVFKRSNVQNKSIGSTRKTDGKLEPINSLFDEEIVASDVESKQPITRKLINYYRKMG